MARASELPTSILLFPHHTQFINVLSFCQDNHFDVTDAIVFGFDAIAIFEDLEIACLIMSMADAVCYFLLPPSQEY